MSQDVQELLFVSKPFPRTQLFFYGIRFSLPVLCSSLSYEQVSQIKILINYSIFCSQVSNEVLFMYILQMFP